jgi:hypothetical protein
MNESEEKPVIYSLYQPPKPKGAYIIGDGVNTVTMPISNKPNFVHQFFCKLLLGWKWQDFKYKDDKND